ncbi:MAG: sulfite exporter TauE/SafE family protein [Bellilinea sp.]
MTETLLAFLIAVPIAVLGGLIGLGGAEFRLPALVGWLRRTAHQAVPINLAVSLVTLLVSLLVRSQTLPTLPLESLMVILAAMIAGAVLTAYLGAGLTARLSPHALEGWMRLLLTAIGLLLIVEGFVPLSEAGLIGEIPLTQAAVGFIAGCLIGVVSSTLGVAGGELIIPTLIFIFGVGIKTAGSASLIISLPTVMVGLARYAHKGLLFSRSDGLRIVLPMGLGSVIGSIIGGVLAVIVPANWLKIILGLVLIASAARMFRRKAATPNG